MPQWKCESIWALLRELEWVYVPFTSRRELREKKKRKFFMFNGINFIFMQCETNKSDQCSLWAEKKNLSIIRQSNTKMCKINWIFASGHRIFQYLCCFPFLFCSYCKIVIHFVFSFFFSSLHWKKLKYKRWPSMPYWEQRVCNGVGRGLSFGCLCLMSMRTCACGIMNYFCQTGVIFTGRLIILT